MISSGSINMGPAILLGLWLSNHRKRLKNDNKSSAEQGIWIEIGAYNLSTPTLLTFLIDKNFVVLD